MVYESYYWKKIIKQDIKYLRKKANLNHTEIDKNIDEHFSHVEIKVMTLAYSARKLSDTNKLPDISLNKKIKLKYFGATDNAQRIYLNIEKEFDLETPIDTYLSVRNICNQIIHSYVLQAVGNHKNPFVHIWFVSDFDKHLGLYQIPFKKFLEIMEDISNSYIKTMRVYFDKTTNKKVTIKK